MPEGQKIIVTVPLQHEAHHYPAAAACMKSRSRYVKYVLGSAALTMF